MTEALPPDLLATPVTGVNLVPGTLRDQLAPNATLLVFLRHFGCIFCRETIVDLRRASEERADFPKVLFFYQGSPTEGRVFLRRYWPSASAVSDPERALYAAFGVERGSLRKMFGPGVWSARRRAASKGISQGERVSDIWMMPGLFLVEGEAVTWAHEFAHAGDHPEFASIPELAGAARGA